MACPANDHSAKVTLVRCRPPIRLRPARPSRRRTASTVPGCWPRLSAGFATSSWPRTCFRRRSRSRSSGGRATASRIARPPGCSRWRATARSTGYAAGTPPSRISRLGRRRSPPADPVDPVPDRLAEVGDERLSLLFTCCHPALAPEARVALTLAGRRRADRRRDRAGLPRARRDDVPAPGARQAQDPRRRDLVRAAGRLPPCPTASRPCSRSST